MAEEDILKLFDSYWFEHVIFTKKPLVDPHEINPVQEICEEIQEPNIQRLPTLHIRSLSDHNLSSNISFSTDSLSDFFSPNSVLTTPKLQTILSGKEVTDSPSDENVKQEEKETPMKPKVSERSRRARKKKGNSKSLSDLEFDELKGFMDLGFVFSEKDKDSSLVSIIPGLQRLGKKDGEDDKEEERIDKHVVSRPYLSEAWDVLDQRKKESPLMNFRIPAVGNEMDMKDHLRFWAHTVASTVR